MAKFYSIDPDIVENWTNVQFIDRQEYMWVYNDLMRTDEDG